MTSGGDAPGMNGVVRAVVRYSIHMKCEAFGIFEGYEGLVQGGNLIKQLYWGDVRGMLSEGGTRIGTVCTFRRVFAFPCTVSGVVSLVAQRRDILSRANRIVNFQDIFDDLTPTF